MQRFNTDMENLVWKKNASSQIWEYFQFKAPETIISSIAIVGWDNIVIVYFKLWISPKRTVVQCKWHYSIRATFRDYLLNLNSENNFDPVHTLDRSSGRATWDIMMSMVRGLGEGKTENAKFQQAEGEKLSERWFPFIATLMCMFVGTKNDFYCCSEMAFCCCSQK